jgi:branched-chain amino acid transport system substrate-binding protein
MKTARSIFLMILLGSLVISGCQAPAGETGLPSVPAATEAPSQGAMPAPSDTPLPPSATPFPTGTPTPTVTATPPPTETPTLTPTFSPKTLVFGAGEPLKIGYLLWETNPIGVDSWRAVELAIKEFGGELSGHPIELVGYDDACNERGGQRGAQLLARDEAVVGVIGTSCSGAALRAAPIISDAGKAMVSPSNTNPLLTAADSRAAGYFRTAPNDISQANAVAQYAFNGLGRRKMASLYTANAKPQKAYSEHLCQAFSDLGGECVLERAVPGGTTFVTPTINAILASGADVIHMTIDLKAAAAFVKGARTTPGLEEAAIFSWELLNTPDFLRQAGDSAVGAYTSVTSYDFDHGTVAYQNFLVMYRNQFGEEPTSQFHAYAFDAATMLLKAVAAVAIEGEDGTLRVDPLAVRDALYRMADFPGLTGRLSCSPQGDCASDSEGRIYQFTSGVPASFNPGPASVPGSNPVQVWP